jgi:hypothetical protein
MYRTVHVRHLVLDRRLSYTHVSSLPVRGATMREPRRPAATVGRMDVTFHREAGSAYHSPARRPDGVVVRLEGGSYNRLDPPLPHDIAHLVFEDELGLEQGVWGVIAAGALFPQCAVVSGRRRPHAAERARSLVKESTTELTQAEIVVGAVCRLAVAGRDPDDRLIARLTGRWRPDSLTPAVVARLRERLQDAAERWRGVPVGRELDLVWDRGGRARSRRG